ncbi:MAG: spore photoproduct lyase family protein [Candidatus Omnitrophota bacterium]
MRFYRESQRLKDTHKTLRLLKLEFGPNKKQELVRLVYEVSKINNIVPQHLLKEALGNNNFHNAKEAFIDLKDFLVKKRYPLAYKSKRKLNFYLPKLNLNRNFSVLKKKANLFYPREIFIEKDAKNYFITKSIIDKFRRAKIVYINDSKAYIKAKQSKTSIKDYNERTKKLFLIKEKHDFLKPCPCSKGVRGCGYYILNLGFSCSYECSYCFLQNYTNVDGIILPVNIEDFIAKLYSFLNYPRQLRIGTGEFTDSLVSDDLTRYSEVLINYFSKSRNTILELKTKSNNINNLLNLKHNRKTAISWSLNPQSLIDSDEWHTSSLRERLDAAKACCDVGYRVGFHFDPIIYSLNWQDLYREVIDLLFKKINQKNIDWISLGTIRFTPKLKTIIEQRFPNSKILDEELVVGFDRKLRYVQQLRIQIYKNMFSWIKKHSGSVLVYLCMEPKEIWKEVLGRTKF